MQLLNRNIHMIGIGGSGMSSAARLLLARGCRVSGSDSTPTEITRELALLGARVSIGHDPENIPPQCDLVVATAAATAGNPELAEAGRRNIEIVKYAKLVGLLMRSSFGICIAGTHGKTTTSSMIAQTMLAAGLHPSYIIGGKIVGHAACDCAGREGFLVAEACEYDRSFLSLHPAYAVLTNLEPDHLDYYGCEENLLEAFGRFISLIPKCGLLLVNRESPRAFEISGAAGCRVETFGVGNDCDWQVITVEKRGHGHSFELRRGAARHTFHVQVPGYHNVLNAAAAAALLVNLGITPQAAADGLATFRGVERRFQVLTPELPTTIIDDYAHHPTEIAAALHAARETYPGRRLWAVFQAHQHSRTRAFFEEFARSLTHADRVTIAKIYSVRETDLDRLSINGGDIAGRLSRLGIETEYVPTFEGIESLLLREALEGDVVIVMGAGDINAVAHSIAATLRERARSELSSAKATL